MLKDSGVYSRVAKDLAQRGKLPITPNSMLVRALHHKNLVPAPDSNAKMLDVGCFDGGHMIYFGKYGYTVSGVDVDAEEILLSEINAKREGVKPLWLKVMKDEILEFNDEEFELVLCWKSIYHTGTRERFIKLLREMIRVLKVGKPIFISMLDNESIHVRDSEKIGENIYKHIMPRRTDGSYVIYYHIPEISEIVNILQNEGIGNIEIGSSSGVLLHKPGADITLLNRSLRIFYGEKV